ncbi:MAG: hypothetical protein JO023_19405 [Chloroflexi bacterium]|nr:hypothetical protein [Chloroflexota bacterium]
MRTSMPSALASRPSSQRPLPLAAWSLLATLTLAASIALGGETTLAQSDQTAAIQQVIQQGDSEQVQALASQDASAMADTSSPEHLQELQQTNAQLLQSGVTAIALNNIEWGPIAVNGSSATATDYETWITTYDDASTEESRDENDYTLEQQNGTWVIVTDDQPDADASGPRPRVATPPPAPTATPGPSGAPGSAAESNNWAGYAATGASFTAVSGTWVIPAFSPSASAGMDATWVGIGGVTSRDLIQAGTEEQTSGSGQTMYSAWLEILPQPSQPVQLTVHAGDSISATVTQQTPTMWQISLTDNTTGQSKQVSGPYQSSGSSAEWIEEAPSAARGGVLPLDTFGSVMFSAASALAGGKQMNLAQLGARPITLADAARQPLVTTSPVGSDGASFTVTRTAAPDTEPGGRTTSRGGGD